MTAAGLASLPAQVVGIPLKTGTEPPKVAPQTGPGQTGNSWFETTDVDMGSFNQDEAASGKFRFKNPSGAAREWKSMQGSCTCTRAVVRIDGSGDVIGREYEMVGKQNEIYRITRSNQGDKREKVGSIQIGAGEGGEVEIHMDMHGVTGLREASVDIYTTDPDLPLVKLKAKATGVVMFNLIPNEVNLNRMAWTEKREFMVQITSPVQKDFNILGHDPLPPELTVSYETQLQNGAATWTVRGTYGPLQSETGGGGIVNLRTDVKGMPIQVRIMALVEGPLEVKPGSFLSLGMIRFGNEKAMRVTFQPNDGTDLKVVNLSFANLSVPEKFLTATATKEGKSVHVDLTVQRDTPSGLLRGDLVVELDHPAAKEKRILFNGFIR